MYVLIDKETGRIIHLSGYKFIGCKNKEDLYKFLDFPETEEIRKVTFET